MIKFSKATKEGFRVIGIMKLDSDVANKEKKLLTVQSEDVESQDMELELLLELLVSERSESESVSSLEVSCATAMLRRS